MDALKGISIVLLILGAFGLVGIMDYEDEQKAQEHYCNMRKIWEDHKDIDPRFRPGWPNYKPEVTCDGVQH